MNSYPSHRQLAGKLVSQEPERVYPALGHPTILRLSRAVARYCWQSPDSPGSVIMNKENAGSREIARATASLAQSVRDISFLTYAALSAPDTQLGMSVRELRPEFLRVATEVALLPQEEIATYYHVQGRQITQGMTMATFTEDTHALTQTDRNSEKGCPFAKERRGTPAPIFNEFVQWSAALAIAAYDYHPAIRGAEAVAAFQDQYAAENQPFFPSFD